MISANQLKYICPNLPQDRANIIAPLLDTISPQYGIDTPDKFHEFISRLCVECNEFNVLQENLNYKTSALLSLFSKERINKAQAEKYGRNENHHADIVGIGNTIYGGNWGKINLGNTQQGDGFLFRGSGAMQITGRANTTNFTNHYNAKMGTSFTPEAMAEMLRTNIEIGIHAACWIFAISFKLIQLAIDDKLEAIVKRINGGLNGLEETKKYYERAKQIII